MTPPDDKAEGASEWAIGWASSWIDEDMARCSQSLNLDDSYTYSDAVRSLAKALDAARALGRSESEAYAAGYDDGAGCECVTCRAHRMLRALSSSAPTAETGAK